MILYCIKIIKYRKTITILKKDRKLAGHSNRIYSVKFDRLNPNVLYSGGWDETLFCWDIRTSKVSSFVHGPLICGDSIDTNFNSILCGSFRGED